MKAFGLALVFLLAVSAHGQAARKTFPFMDSGVDSAKPATCPVPSFYLATDTQNLYVCNGGVLILVSAIGGGVSLNPAGAQIINNAAAGGISLQNLACASLDVFTQSDAGCGATYNTIILRSPSGSAVNNLRKALSIYFQSALSNTAAAEYIGSQVNAFGLVDGTTQASAQLQGINVQVGLKANGATNASGLSAIGFSAQPRASGTSGGSFQSFHSFNPQFVSGATVGSLYGFNCDHAAIGSSLVTGANLCFTGVVGSGGWGADLFGSGTGGSLSLATGRACHGTDVIANGGTPTDCWYAKGAFSSLPTCSSTTEGSFAAVTDSNTVTWGANIAGSSTNHVLGYCDGSNWTVAAK